MLYLLLLLKESWEIIIWKIVLFNWWLWCRWWWWWWWWWWWCCWWIWKLPGFHHRCLIKGAKYTIQKIFSSHLQIIQADDFRERCKTKQSIQRQKNYAPPHSMLHWPWTCAIISFFQASKVNIPYLPITCFRTIFIAWVFLMILITSIARII